MRQKQFQNNIFSWKKYVLKKYKIQNTRKIDDKKS